MDPALLSQALGISHEAAELYSACEVVDLHLDTFIWQRLFGYDLTRRHGEGPFGARFFGQADLPRVRAAGMAAGLWIITTNPLRSRRGKRDACLRNLAQLSALLDGAESTPVSTLSEYRDARALGKHAAFIGLQGGNALELDLSDFDRPEVARLCLVTLLHFTRSRIGAPALPRWLCWGSPRLTSFGIEYVRRLNEKRILVDLAHLHPAGFADVLRVHDPALPLLVSHAACHAVRPHFRNLTDAQLVQVAERGGVVGIVFNAGFVGASVWRANVQQVTDHILHAVRVMGDDHVALGSDFDGAIIPPRDLRTVLQLPRVVDSMLARGLGADSVRKVMGLNFLRVLGAVRA